MTVRTFAAFTSVSILALLAGCGGSGDGGTQTGTLNIGLTDNPALMASAVVVAFTGIELKSAANAGPMEPVIFDENSCDDFDAATGTCSIDLLTLTGNNREVVFSGDIPAGEYQWVRLLVDADRNEMDSYIELANGDMCSLWIPSGSETGLKIVSGITVTANGVSDYTLDFDAASSVAAPPGLATGSALACNENYVLKPAIRIVDTTETGSIEGSFDSALLTDSNGDLLAGCRDDNPADGIVDELAVYVFEDLPDQTPVSVDDYDGERDPIAMAVVEGDGSSYAYEVGYLLEGSYRLGLTCTPDVDVMPSTEPLPMDVDNFDCAFGQDDNCEETDPPFDFVDERLVTVEIDAVSNGDFPAPNTP